MPDPVGLAAREILWTPWSPDVVHALNEQQDADPVNAFACPQHRGVRLFATRYGWICAAVVSQWQVCRYRQAWIQRSDLS